MSALDFPNSPTSGQQYAAPNGVTYQWDGVVWATLGGVTSGPVGPAGGDLQGTYPNPTIIPSHLPWTPSQPTGGTLTPTDATKQVSIVGDGTKANLVLGSQTTKTRVVASNTAAWAGMAINLDPTTGTQDDVSKPSWELLLRPDLDLFRVFRAPPGAGPVSLLTLDNAGNLTVAGTNIYLTPATATPGQLQINGYVAGGGSPAVRCYSSRGAPGAPAATQTNDVLAQLSGVGYGTQYGEFGLIRFLAWENWTATAHGTYCQIMGTPIGSSVIATTLQVDGSGNLVISGANATKASGTTWANPSDRRLKDDIADYPTGLAAIRALHPRTFVYNGKAGSAAGLRGYGFIADEIAPIMPEMVGTRRAKLHADDAEETDIQTLDTSNLVLALVNAVQELEARLRAVEAR